MASCELVLVVCSRATYLPVLEVLRDWSVVGVVSPLIVIDSEAIRADDVRVPALVLDGGRSRPVLLQEELSTRSSTGRARLIAVSEVGATVISPGNGTGERLTETVQGALPSIELVRMHLIGLALQGAAPTEDLAWVGWHNVVVAPENAPSPTSGVAPIVFAPSDPVRISHLVGTLCSLAGLWSAEPWGPFDDRALPPGRSLVAARTFTRHLSATAVESELLDRLAAVDQGYPVPLVDGSSALQVEDQIGAATEMADKLLAKHPYVLPRERVTPARARPQPIGAMTALKMLFAFLGGVIRNAPKAFVDRLVHATSTAVARRVSTMVFGRGDSEYAVVVNGVTADGLPASWLALDAALENAAVRANGGQPLVHASHLDLSGFWKDFVFGGLTLLDAGGRSEELAPRMSGGRRAVLIDGRIVAPDPSDLYTPPDNVGAYVKKRQVAPSDAVGARLLSRQLGHVAQTTPHVKGPADAARADLQAWYLQRERTYTGRIGQRLSGGISQVRGEIDSYSNTLRTAEEQAAVPPAIEEQQRRLASRLRLILGVALLLVVVAIVLALTVLGLIFLVGAVLVIVVGWLVSSFLTFVRGQRDLFALLHERRQLMDELEIIRRHLIEAIEDLRRLGRSYRQYLDWTGALGRFVAAPLGKPTASLDEEQLLGRGLPRNHRFGAARPDPRALDEIAARVRRDIFGVGWASGAWEAFVADLPDDLGQVGFRIREDHEVLFADPDVARESLLTTWSNKVQQRRDWPGATAMLQAMLASLSGPSKQQIGPTVLANVESCDVDGTVVTGNYESFVDRLDDESALVGVHQAFSRAMFGPQAIGEPWQVASTETRQPTADFSRTIVVTQLSQGFSAYELNTGPGEAPPPPPQFPSSAPIM